MNCVLSTAIREQVVKLDDLMFNFLFFAQCKRKMTWRPYVVVDVLLALDGVTALAEGGSSLPSLFLGLSFLLLPLGQHLGVLSSGLLDNVKVLF